MRRNMMPWLEHVGRVFHRRTNIREVFGGNQVMGISESPIEETVIVVSDPHGNKYNYHDRFLADGSYEYYGQRAQAGDPWRNNNHQIRDHAENGRSLLLFLKENDEYRFDGEWFYNRHQIIDVRGVEQVVFNLVNGRDLRQENLERDIAALQRENAGALRERAIAAGNRNPAIRERAGNVYQRAAMVAAHVLNRAGGLCECCGEAAPFNRADGRPYLECHHVDRLADQGADDIYSVIALHPVCHRFVHHAGEAGRARNDEMRNRLREIEPRPAL
ncbi:HNH endonuclease [Shinella sp.]|uniref:HNH endonuclease n=1 Tax=Shinella sp. TaxID=1870904 RepID=UPI003C75CD2E